ncbi:hypothetical protein DAPPUDRAFT_118502 [Daphnia pulex]|uniref:Uncharacterized protein n=1 Tax=Daphnia pulex TaxID=6669 RepID=E9HVT3_DAPPU|nr:hypothetical protein DAPPUDRAFT_118502 [Daphnia pulex]|eukprot:EFX64146.1 hypothetical protein DAPPUDRAFT_118502 [Daphnia pulex]
MADQEHGHYVDAGLLGEDVRQLGHGAEMEVPPPLIHVGNEYFQYQAGLCKVEPPWHEPDIGIPFNVPQNVPSQCAFRSTSLDQTRAVDQEQHCEKDASSTPELSDERVGGHVLRSRRRLKSPTRLDL